jgi:hypothetical protein
MLIVLEGNSRTKFCSGHGSVDPPVEIPPVSLFLPKDELPRNSADVASPGPSCEYTILQIEASKDTRGKGQAESE